VEQVYRTMLRSGELQAVEEASNPRGENPENDQDQERGPDHVHDGLEMTLILGTLNQRRSLTDKGAAGGLGHNSIGFASLAASRIVTDITHVLVDRKRFSRDGRLISRDDGGASVLAVLIVVRVSMGL
jgi:hypothetical protein